MTKTHDLELTPGLFLHGDVHHFIDILHLRNFHHLLNLRHHWHIHLWDWVAIPTGKGRTEWEVTCDISGCSWFYWARDTDAHQIEKEISDVAITYNNMHSVMMRNYNNCIYNIYSCLYLHSRAICMSKISRSCSRFTTAVVHLFGDWNLHDLIDKLHLYHAAVAGWKEPLNFLMSIQKSQIYLDILQK